MKILFAGGGTAGHINPALAIANYICKNNENTEVLFVGTEEGLEKSLVPHGGYGLETIKIHGFERKISFETLKTVLEIPTAVLASKKIIKKFKPDVVVGTGGYVCGPVVYAAAKMGIPTFIHESNAFPGVTTKILSGVADVVAVGVEAAGKYLPKAKKLVLTGNPIRPSIMAVDDFAARRTLGLDSRPFILFFGGSLGARDFNKVVTDWISSVAEEGKYQILMGTGKLNQMDAVKERFLANGVNIEKYPHITISEYIYDMDIAMNGADLVVSRAGASTLAELTAIGKPSVLVPSPYVTDNHQYHNAKAVEDGGGAKVITEDEFTVEALNKAITEIIETPGKLLEMKRGAAKMGVPDSLELICREIKGLAG
ncbi:MAG: undecaprenyldiphospho-muramoylpentapeptide beta-N-acetylglucosaminyltransferase [Clostridia bacterium]|nr:undecaprenyldiphospho-muramoylpentapeptide beta-N-acetylglucosaminyltransferase [Clostridia bacterium]